MDRLFFGMVICAGVLLAPAAWGVDPVDCSMNPTCTVQGVTRICDHCFGDDISCPIQVEINQNICPGICFDGTNDGDPCVQQSDCVGPGASCQFFTRHPGEVTHCYGTGAAPGGFITADVVCLGPDDDNVPLFLAIKPVQMNTGDGNDTVNILFASVPVIVEGGTGDDTLRNNTSTAVTLVGGPGSDTLFGGSGKDVLIGNGRWDFSDQGDDEISGGGGDDTLIGSEGDDILLGFAGDDVIVGQGGSDELDGGAGNDFLMSNLFYVPIDNTPGSNLCGGSGDDRLIGAGPGHQCMDAGSGQVVVGAESDCSYWNAPATTDPGDFGTVRNCLNPTKIGTSGVLLGDADCGCSP